jgi:hypothetical protein
MQKTLLAGLIGVAVIIGAGAYFYALRTHPVPAEFEAVVSTQAPPQESAREVPPGYKEYKNGRFGFSLLYPEGMSVKEVMETATSHSIAFHMPQGAAFQIFVVAYADTQITDERFRMDVPSGVRKNTREIAIDGVPAVAFESESGDIGETQEIWFIKNGYLFEVTTYRPLADDLSAIMQTWKFIR